MIDTPSNDGMSSSRPYLIRAIHQWISDNALTPYLVVDATDEQATVPLAHVNEGEIVLNCSESAVAGLMMENDWISFNARFNGAPEEISFPPSAVRAIYARENGQGMIFPQEERPSAAEAGAEESDEAKPAAIEEQKRERPKGGPSLKIVK